MTKHKTLWLALIFSLIAGLVAVPAASAAPVSSPDSLPLPRQDAATKPYLWEEMGISFEIPADWQAYPASQDYDLALVSAATAQGSEGAYLTFSAVPYLGQTFEEAMQPLAEEVGSTLEAYTVAGLTGVRVVSTDAETGDQQWLVLLPYGESDESLYIQGLTPTADAGLFDAIFASIAIDQPVSDAEAINAAWQASLAENGTLVYGGADAPVHVAEYMSFTCGHCANYTVQIERLIALEVEGAGRVRFELTPVYWDDYAMRATNSLYCAVEQGQGYSAYKALYHGYFVDGYDVAYTDEGLSAIMSGLGLDMDQYAACLEDGRYADTIAAVETRFRDGGISATPTLTFGLQGAEPAPIPVGDGEIWSGAIPLSTVRQLLTMFIDEGVPVEQIFAE